VNDRLSRRRFLARAAGATGGLVLTAVAASGSPAAAAVSAGSPGSPGATGGGSDSRSVGRPPSQLASTELLAWFDQLYRQVKAERFSPPAAARAHGHILVAAYEMVAVGSPHLRSLGGQLNGFGPQPRRSLAINWLVAVNEAIAVAADAVFADRSDGARQVLAGYAADRRAALTSGLPAPVVERSLVEGRSVGRAVAGRANADGYLGTLGRPYSPPVGPDKWVRTPPNFGAAIEPFWGEVQAFALASNDECKPIPPVPYSEEVGSPFWTQANVVYETSFAVTDQQRQLALFWRDNPDGSTGLPSGHWLAIAATVIADQGLMLDRAAEIMALTAIATADGFTSCWTEKYETNLLRPVTYVQRIIDPSWNTFVNSPAFPEYTSGHSVGSGAASAMLTHLLGDGVGFIDTIGRQNGHPDQTYRSFREAAEEAALSRLWGSIHYPMGIEEGLVQGRHVAELLIGRLHTR